MQRNEIEKNILERATEIAEEEKLSAQEAEKLKGFILSTTPTIEGNTITSYLGIVGAQAVEGVNIFKDAFAGLRNVVGGRSAKLQETMESMRNSALDEMKMEAYKLGANAVVGIKIDFDEYSEGMLMLSISGTAVSIESKLQ